MSEDKTRSKSKKSRQKNSSALPYGEAQLADGGELHQVAGGEHPALTTNQGVVLSDNQNSLRANLRGPTLLEDFILREKMVPVHLRAAHTTDGFSAGQSILMQQHVASRSGAICRYADGLVRGKIDAYGYDERVRRQQS